MKFSETSLLVLHIPEPPLEFSYGQKSPYPKDGLFLTDHILSHRDSASFDRCDRQRSGRRSLQRLGQKAQGPHRSSSAEVGWKKNCLHLSNFPGIEEAFGISFDPTRSFPMRLIRRNSMRRPAPSTCTKLSERRSKSTSQSQAAQQKRRTQNRRLVSDPARTRIRTMQAEGKTDGRTARQG